MKFRDIIFTANNNLRRSKLRTLLTSSAIFIGALTLMLTTGIGYGLRNYVKEQVSAAGAKDALIIMASHNNEGLLKNGEAQKYNPDEKSSGFGFAEIPKLSNKDLVQIGESKNIKQVDPLYPLVVEYIEKDNNKYKATIAQSVEDLNIPLSAGRHVNVNGEKHEITLVPSLVQPLGFSSNEDALGKIVHLAFKDVRGKIFILEATVVGVQEKTFIQGNSMSINIGLAKEAFLKATAGIPDLQRFQYTTAIAIFDKSISSDELDKLKSNLEAKGYKALTLEDQLGTINSIINGITTFLNIFAAIALATASFGIVNTLLMAVQERTREIGLMKALGMRRQKIFILFSFEALLIGFWSSLLALGTANIIGRIGSDIASKSILKDFEGLELFSFPALPMAGVIVLVMIIAFVASALPARKASKLNPIDALRTE